MRHGNGERCESFKAYPIGGRRGILWIGISVRYRRFMNTHHAAHHRPVKGYHTRQPTLRKTNTKQKQFIYRRNRHNLFVIRVCLWDSAAGPFKSE